MPQYTIATLPSNLRTGDTVRIDYTGAMQTIPPLANVKSVKIECYGAKGGNYSTYVGGSGGYAVGELQLSTPRALYAYVGQYPGTSTNDAGGGGASDVRTAIGTLASRLIVAAGGGGANSGNGGHGGGWIGNQSDNSSASTTGTSAIPGGGGQTSGGTGQVAGALGVGGGVASGIVQQGGFNGGGNSDGTYCGGGGGYYGGASGNNSGGGGSSYVAGNANCPTAHSEGLTLQNSSTTTGVNTGHGYIIITVLKAFTELAAFTLGSPYAKDSIDTIRTKVNEFRVANGLAAYVWTDPTITKKVTPIKALHWNEIQTAIDEVFTQTTTAYAASEVSQKIKETVLSKNTKYGIKELSDRQQKILRALQNI